MSKQTLSIEQMQHLKNLGVDTSKATFCVNVADEDKHIFTYDTYYSLIEYSCETHPVFTLQDVLDLLPKEIMPHTTPYSLYIDYQEMRVAYCFVDREGMCWLEPTFSIDEKELIDAAYEMLCWVIENGYLKVK